MRSSPRKIPWSNFLGLLDLRILKALAWKDRSLQFPHSIPASWPSRPCLHTFGDGCLLPVGKTHAIFFFFFLSLFLNL